MGPMPQQRAAYRARDVVRVPGLLSLSRVPLAALFPLAKDARAAFAILVVAGVTDVLDGWYARRFSQATPTGAALDPLTDKVFVTSVVVTLVARDLLPLRLVPLLGARELIELPLALWLLASARARLLRADNPKANVPGKLATAAQFACLTLALFGAGSSVVGAVSVVAAAFGAIAAVLYWRGFIAALRSAPP